MPRHIKPMLATLAAMPKDQAAFGFEYKWDGVRALGPVNGVLCLETMHFADEVVAPESLEGAPGAKVNDKELKMAEQLIDTLADSFDPTRYRDEYRDRLEELIRKKAEGQEVELPPAAERPQQVLSLVKALKQSLAEQQKKKKAQKQKKTA